MINSTENKINHFPRFLTILSIPFAFSFALFLGYINIIPLKVETHSIIIIFIILLIFMFFISHNAWYAFSFFRNSLYDVINNIEEYLSSNELTIAGKRKSYGNIEPFFDEHIKNIRNDNFASVAASIFPTLGILGTFIAIAISMPDFTVESGAALDKEITLLLSGIGTAFYASIFGIFLSLWWIFFEKRGLSKIQKDIDILKSEYKSRIWDKEELEVLSIFETKSHNQKLLEKLESIVTPEFVFTLDNIAKAKLELVEKLTVEHKESEKKMFEGYSKLVDMFENGRNYQRDIIHDYKQLHDSLNNTNKHLAQAIEEQSKQSKALKAEVYTILSSLELVSSDMKKLGKEIVEKEQE